jgi:Ca2+-binding EF-hand superfamily protein
VDLNEASENDALFVAFKSLDQDRDGNLTREEFAAYKGAKSLAPAHALQTDSRERATIGRAFHYRVGD